MSEQHADKDFIEYIIKQIVNNPIDVVVTRVTDEMGVLIEVKVNPQDMGLLIGREGATAKAFRVLARIIGMRANARVNLRILEPDGGRIQKPESSDQHPETSSVPDAPKEPSMRALESDSDIDAMMKDLQA